MQVDVAAALAWAPAMVVTETLRKLGPNASAVQIRDYIAHIKGMPGIDGIFDFEKVPQRGLDDGNAVVTRWDTGRKTWVVLSRPGGMPIAK